ncbi:hypothetical protein M422DRAFT_246866 [Sphaerobolus stellatus SS14]|nr:hypothetical protein M422DRAFT_246866 [Sphaerobolus stellatus SS14]
MNAQVDDAQRHIADLGLNNSSPVVEAVSSTGDISQFNALVKLAEDISEIHPYAKIASSVLLSAYHVWKDQKDRDSNMFKLLQTIYDFGNLIIEQIIDCSQFISHYCRDKSFALKAVKHIFSNIDDAVKKYTASFDKLKLAFTDAATVSTQLNVINLTASLAALHIDVNLNDMPFAEGARYKSGKGCIQGTRVEVLDAITQWAFEENLDSHICLLLGPAGAGKSAIAYSVARIFDDLGCLGSSFCFIHDQHIKRALGHVLGATSLRKTDDLQDQFNHFIVKTVQECSMIGPILLVIDALDECGDGKLRKEFLKLLTNPKTMKKLPSNFRIFITSRPDQDVQELFSKMHILQLQDQQYKRNTDKDIFSFVHQELLVEPALKGFTKDHCYQVVKKSEGLFQWASVACQFVQEAAENAQSPIYALEQILTAGSGLYDLYTTTVNNRFKRINEPRFSQQFKRALGFVLGVSKPLPKKSLSLLWRLAFGGSIAFEVDLILPHLGSLFNGIGDTTVVTPIHTSVRDFFTSSKDSGAFFINTEEHHLDISLGLLHVLTTQLFFNICQIKTSYYRNSNSKDLKEAIQKEISPELPYACEFLGTHIQKLSDADKQDKRMHPMLKEFLEKKLLFWFEALGLLKKIDCAISCLSEILPLTKHFSESFSQRTRVSTGQEAHWPALEATLIGHSDKVYSVAFSSDGQRVVSGSSDETIRIWNAHTGELVSGSFKGHTGLVSSVAFSPDGQRVASGSHDKTIRIWNAHTGKLVSGPFKGSSDETIRIWNALTGELVSGPFEGHTGLVNSVAFSPDGQRVVSGSDDKTIRIWNPYTGELVTQLFEGHTDQVTPASPLGQQILVSESHNNSSQPPNTFEYSISFSPNKHHSINLLSLSESITSLDSISFNKDTGYITGPNKELIFWIPFSYRERLWLPRYLAIMGMDTVTLDLSQFVHGPSWTDCWKSE